MAILSVKQAFAIDEKGVTRIFHPGQLVDSDDPAVKGREVLFDTVEDVVGRRTGQVPASDVIEAATAEPGQKRARSAAKVTER